MDDALGADRAGRGLEWPVSVGFPTEGTGGPNRPRAREAERAQDPDRQLGHTESWGHFPWHSQRPAPPQQPRRASVVTRGPRELRRSRMRGQGRAGSQRRRQRLGEPRPIAGPPQSLCPFSVETVTPGAAPAPGHSKAPAPALCLEGWRSLHCVYAGGGLPQRCQEP